MNNNKASILSKIIHSMSFDKEKSEGGIIFKALINSIANKHINGEIKNLQVYIDDLIVNSGNTHEDEMIKAKAIAFKSIYDNILNDEDKSKIFFKNIIENNTNPKCEEKFILNNKFLSNVYYTSTYNVLYQESKTFYGDEDIKNKYVEGLFNEIMKFKNDEKKKELITPFFNFNDNYIIKTSIQTLLFEKKDINGLIDYINFIGTEGLFPRVYGTVKDLVQNKEKINDFESLRIEALELFASKNFKKYQISGIVKDFYENDTEGLIKDLKSKDYSKNEKLYILLDLELTKEETIELGLKNNFFTKDDFEVASKFISRYSRLPENTSELTSSFFDNAKSFDR